MEIEKLIYTCFSLHRTYLVLSKLGKFYGDLTIGKLIMLKPLDKFRALSFQLSNRCLAITQLRNLGTKKCTYQFDDEVFLPSASISLDTKPEARAHHEYLTRAIHSSYCSSYSVG